MTMSQPQAAACTLFPVKQAVGGQVDELQWERTAVREPTSLSPPFSPLANLCVVQRIPPANTHMPYEKPQAVPERGAGGGTNCLRQDLRPGLCVAGRELKMRGGTGK